jgi:hypothetical protein
MLQKIKAFLYGSRWRADEHAWRVWQGLASLVPANFVDLDSRQPLVGRVQRIYQQAHRGTKAVVHFGSVVGLQDTWWEGMRPPVNQWVVVRTHLWFPPGTHSEQHVVWIDAWESRAPGDTYVRALRHERRLEKKKLSVSPQASQSGQGEAVAWDPARDILRGQALWRRDAFAAAADIDEVMSSAIDVAAEMSAKTYGPSEVGGGRLLTMWPPDQTPTFVSVTARPVSSETVWIAVSAQSLAVPSLDVADEVQAALESRLGKLGPEARAAPREIEYDREATRRLEAEIQGLLEDMASDAISWGHASSSIYERESRLQHLTGLGA